MLFNHMNLNDIRNLMSLILLFFALGGMTYDLYLYTHIQENIANVPRRPPKTTMDSPRLLRMAEDHRGPPKTAKDCQRLSKTSKDPLRLLRTPNETRCPILTGVSIKIKR